HRLRTHSRGALREAGELQGDHQARDALGDWRSNSGAMRQHDVSLERSEIGISNANVRQFSESGVDPVNRPSGPHNSFYRSCALGDASTACAVQRHGFAAIDLAPIVQADLTRLEHYCCQLPLQMRACSGFKPIWPTS